MRKRKAGELTVTPKHRPQLASANVSDYTRVHVSLISLLAPSVFQTNRRCVTVPEAGTQAFPWATLPGQAGGWTAALPVNPQLHRLQSRPDSALRRGGVWMLAASFGSQRLEVPFYTDTLINFCALLEKCH
ncbi:unnamed protein product [Rangifer tarandus platyrhynchus]|uniref:Uncharacterized protein n=1 Tax=Rangifer tarandus platyrhynchus TaxID=3082113 RepID=A0AC60A6Q3_RANTA